MEVEDIERLVDSQRDTFERMLLGCLDKVKIYYDQVGSMVCKASDGSFSYDFDRPIHNMIFRVLQAYYAVKGPVMVCDPISMDLARTFLATFASGGKSGVAYEDIDLVLEVMCEIRAVDNDQHMGLVMKGFDYWLRKQKVFKSLQLSTASTDWTPTTVLEDAAKEMRVVNSNKRQTLFGIGETLDEPEIFVERKSTGIAELDHVLGGGLGKTEHILFIAPTGAGKTVMACQLANALAMQDDKGILITTEQPRNELMERMVSANCNTSFSRVIRQGWRNLDERELELYNQWRPAVDGNLFILEWMQDRGQSVVDDLDAVIIENKARLGQLDFIILDWIGGALGTLSANNADKLRILYQITADKMADVCRDHNLRGVSFAQASPVSAANKKKVDQTTLQECKTMGNNATAVFGITALLDESGDDETVAYSDDQFLYCSKGRKAKNKHIKLKREFANQRFRAVG